MIESSVGAEQVHQYNVFSLVFSWFALANIWLTFSIIIDLLPNQGIVIFGGVTAVSTT